MLVRPDGYLAAGAALQQPETIERYLRKLTSRTADDDATPTGQVEGSGSGSRFVGATSLA